MKIQEEIPFTARMLDTFDEDYEKAVVHLAWDRNSETAEIVLLFAYVELLPVEVPVPIDEYCPRSKRSGRRLGSKSKHHVYVRHSVCAARDALSWYLGCKQGVALLPLEDGAIPESTAPNAKRLTIAELGEEPLWPNLTCVSEETDILPFAAYWIRLGSSRTHRLIPSVDFSLDSVWSVSEQKKAQEWLSEALHFELEAYPEYWGSIHMIAPNPIYRRLHMRLQHRGDKRDSVLFQFQRRAGKSVDGLDLFVRETEPWGETCLKRSKLKSPLVRLNFDREVNMVTFAVYDKCRGILSPFSEPCTFIGQFVMELGLLTSLVVKTPSRSYEVMRTEKTTPVTVGAKTKTAPARTRLLNAHYARDKARTGRQLNQRWFRDQKDEARELLQGLFHTAERELLFIDPYFTAGELPELLAVGRTHVPIRILSSTELTNIEPLDPSGREKGELLSAALNHLKSFQRMNPFEVRVMPGSAIHDRFLLVDDRIWHIGSSLNAFGSKGTMMVALPDPDAVREDLWKAWKESVPLETWVEQRVLNRNLAQGGKK